MTTSALLAAAIEAVPTADPQAVRTLSCMTCGYAWQEACIQKPGRRGGASMDVLGEASTLFRRALGHEKKEAFYTEPLKADEVQAALEKALAEVDG